MEDIVNYRIHLVYQRLKNMASWAKRLLLSSMIMALNFTLLAADSGRFLGDTVRVDPFDKLKKYRGGYDITNKHYWSSTAFTGIYGYVLAVVWLLCGIGYGVFLIVKRICMKSRKLKKRAPCHKTCYLQPLVLGLAFTILAIMGSGLVLGGNAKFHSRAKTVIDVIIDTADDASDTIYNTTGAMRDMVTRLRDVNADPRETQFLTSTSRRLDSQANDIARQASKNKGLIDRVLNIVHARAMKHHKMNAYSDGNMQPMEEIEENGETWVDHMQTDDEDLLTDKSSDNNKRR